jgi:hypothetical protein
MNRLAVREAAPNAGGAVRPAGLEPEVDLEVGGHLIVNRFETSLKLVAPVPLLAFTDESYQGRRLELGKQLVLEVRVTSGTGLSGQSACLH